MIRKILLSLLLLIGANQVVSAQLRVELGGSLSNLKSVTEKPSLDFTKGLGYRIGAAYEIGLIPMVYIAPGLQVRNNSVSIASQGFGKVTYTDVVVPVNIGVSVGLGFAGLSLEGGPYASYNLKSSYSAPSISESVSSLGTIDFTSFSFEKLRYGVGASVAFHFTKFYLRGGVDYDLNDLYKSGSDQGLINSVQTELNNLKSQNMTAYLSLGFRL